MKNINKAQNKGITLIALVITIIVLLILAGVAINMAIDSDGLFGKANEATEKWNTAVGEESTEINNLLNNYLLNEEDDEDDETSSAMITKWNIVAGDTVKICLYDNWEDGKELENDTNVTIDWGDGSVEIYTSSNLQYSSGEGYATHTYSVANTETTVTITGQCNTIAMLDNTQLTSIEQWGNTESIYYSFAGCSNLETIASPQTNTFERVKDFCIYLVRRGVNNPCGFFEDCTSLKILPENLFAGCVNATSFGRAFYGCSSLRELPEGLLTDCVNITSFNFAFEGCSSLIKLPDELFTDCVNVTSFYSAFRDCSSLMELPEGLFTNCSVVERFDYTFYNCTSLTGDAIPLWERWNEESDDYYAEDFEATADKPRGFGCYKGCSSLSDFAEIPTGWK